MASNAYFFAIHSSAVSYKYIYFMENEDRKIHSHTQFAGKSIVYFCIHATLSDSAFVFVQFSYFSLVFLHCVWLLYRICCCCCCFCYCFCVIVGRELAFVEWLLMITDHGMQSFWAELRSAKNILREINNTVWWWWWWFSILTNQRRRNVLQTKQLIEHK